MLPQCDGLFHTPRARTPRVRTPRARTSRDRHSSASLDAPTDIWVHYKAAPARQKIGCVKSLDAMKRRIARTGNPGGRPMANAWSQRLTEFEQGAAVVIASLFCRALGNIQVPPAPAAKASVPRRPTANPICERAAASISRLSVALHRSFELAARSTIAIFLGRSPCAIPHQQPIILASILHCRGGSGLRTRAVIRFQTLRNHEHVARSLPPALDANGA
jgi:hypothetical protein